jgi:U4/U6.U5 tri-snRNP-associated protein 1
LGDADPDVDDTLKWIKKAKKREKELAKKRQEELENMDKQFQGQDYSESKCNESIMLLCLCKG